MIHSDVRVRSGVQNVTTRQHFKITGHKKWQIKTITKDEARSHDDEALCAVAPTVDIATSMKQPFTETVFLHEK